MVMAAVSARTAGQERDARLTWGLSPSVTLPALRRACASQTTHVCANLSTREMGSPAQVSIMANIKGKAEGECVSGFGAQPRLIDCQVALLEPFRIS